MSLPHYKMTMLAVTLGIASAMVGCSSNPKKEVVDKGTESSEQVYIQKAQNALDRKQYTDAAKQLEALETYYPTSQYAPQAQLELLYPSESATSKCRLCLLCSWCSEYGAEL